MTLPMARLSRRPMFFQVLPPVERLVDAIALRNIAADAGLARAYINGVAIGIGHGQAANGTASLFIEDRRPGHGAVGGLPDSAASRAEIVSRGIAGDAGSGQRASAAKGADEAIFMPLNSLSSGCRIRSVTGGF